MTTPDTAGVLKPCPFCGGKAHILTGMVAFTDVEITCTVCSVTGGNEDRGSVDASRAAAIAAWNTRPSVDREVVERVRAEDIKIAKGFVAELRKRAAKDERILKISLMQAEGLADALSALLSTIGDK